MGETAYFHDPLDGKTPRVFVTYIIIVINVIVFGLMIASGVDPMSPSVQDAHAWGASFGPSVTSGEWWRLAAANWIHYGIPHIAMNMVVFYDGGRTIERLLGPVGFLVLYLVSGIGGSIVSLAFKPMAVAAGASGAVFGVFGGIGAIMLINRDLFPKEVSQRMLRSIGLFIALNIAIGLGIPSIDMAGHIGGLAVGFLCGLVLRTTINTERAARSKRILVVAAAAAAVFAGAIFLIPKADGSPLIVKRWNTEQISTLELRYDNNLTAQQASAVALGMRRLGIGDGGSAEVFVWKENNVWHFGGVYSKRPPDLLLHLAAHNTSHLLGDVPVVGVAFNQSFEEIARVPFDKQFTPKLLQARFDKVNQGSTTGYFADNLREPTKKLAALVAKEGLPQFFVEKHTTGLLVTFVATDWSQKNEPAWKASWRTLAQTLSETVGQSVTIRLITPDLQQDLILQL